MAEVDPTQEKLKKYEKAVKKLKAANDKAAKELTTQKSTFDEALAEKSALVESLKAAAEGAKEDGGGGDGLQEKVEEQEEKIKEGKENVKKMEENMKLQEAATKDKLETQKTKLETEWKKKFEEALLNTEAPKKEKKGSSDEVPNDYIPGGVEPWMATFADMVTLLMVFFVLFYSVEKDNVGKFKAAIEQQVADEGASAPGLAQMLKVMDEVKIQKTLRELMDKKKEDFKETPQKKIVLRVPGLSLFKPGGAKLTSDARPVLDEILKIVKKHGEHKIFIQGHTDDVPIHTKKFDSNWELSAVRATAVLRYFIDKGIDPEKLTATGYADIFPQAPNNTKKGRAKNRRVEFVLVKEEGEDPAKKEAKEPEKQS
ncbi:uncharacterized protein METZ01_LOCUS266128 [marine metagenome]|uniref:OmpA-like domain-containing protein n=1 Tax=marine metagenome TaxID=408172 RepID=A0A382JLI3_9ZZZZ